MTKYEAVLKNRETGRTFTRHLKAATLKAAKKHALDGHEESVLVSIEPLDAANRRRDKESGAAAKISDREEAIRQAADKKAADEHSVRMAEVVAETDRQNEEAARRAESATVLPISRRAKGKGAKKTTRRGR